MCYDKICSKCGKTTWGGCGMHVKSVYNRIPAGQRCTCHAWPGIKIGDDATAGASQEQEASSSGCTIL